MLQIQDAMDAVAISAKHAKEEKEPQVMLGGRGIMVLVLMLPVR